MEYTIVPISTVSVMGGLSAPPDPKHNTIWFSERPLRGDEFVYPTKDGELFKCVVLGVRFIAMDTGTGFEAKSHILIGRNL